VFCPSARWAHPGFQVAIRGEATVHLVTVSDLIAAGYAFRPNAAPPLDDDGPFRPVPGVTLDRVAAWADRARASYYRNNRYL
jgi:hypothetical protein